MPSVDPIAYTLKTDEILALFRKITNLLFLAKDKKTRSTKFYHTVFCLAGPGFMNILYTSTSVRFKRWYMAGEAQRRQHMCVASKRRR